MKFKVGEKVRVREDLIERNNYGDDTFVAEMNEFKGQVLTISKVRDDNCYFLLEDEMGWYWNDEMLEPVEEKLFDNCANRAENFYCKAVNCYMPNLDKWKPIEEKQPEQVMKKQVQRIAKENKKSCDDCKHNGDSFDCSQCYDMDEWEEKEDLIHKPLHYTYSKYEPIDVIKEWNLDFDLGNVVKYIARCEHKGNKLLDLNKALEYLQHEIKHLEN